jgi:hypothetical protein
MALLFLSLLPSPIHSFPTTTTSLLNSTIPLASQQQQFSNWTFPPSPLQSAAHQNVVALGEEAEEPHPIFDINGQSPEEEHRPSHFEVFRGHQNGTKLNGTKIKSVQNANLEIFIFEKNSAKRVNIKFREWHEEIY